MALESPCNFELDPPFVLQIAACVSAFNILDETLCRHPTNDVAKVRCNCLSDIVIEQEHILRCLLSRCLTLEVSAWQNEIYDAFTILPSHPDKHPVPMLCFSSVPQLLSLPHRSLGA
jgi:hypothetical protein